MTYDFSQEVTEQIKIHMATGRYDSEEQIVLDALRALSEEEDDLLAAEIENH